jgi:hypothetical protein
MIPIDKDENGKLCKVCRPSNNLMYVVLFVCKLIPQMINMFVS